MSKNIVICLDGTWNKPDEPDEAASKETNVRSLYEMCVNDGRQQVAYYDQGVGTEWYDKKIGGATGLGLSKNVKEAYTELARHYEPGDKVFLFGFSRGAYTARSLSGLLYSCGSLSASAVSEKSVEDVYEIYREGDDRAQRQWKARNVPCPVALIGVWDTVGALGIPTFFLADPTAKLYEFHNVDLNPEVTAAYHALALDEERATFEPALWDESRTRADQMVQQVWFAGVHCDVGGGYAERCHSDVAFKWMIDQADGHGLMRKEDHGYQFDPDVARDIHDSYKKIFGSRRHRVVEHTSPTYKPKVHMSVRQRIQDRPDYRPPALVDLQNEETLAPYEVVGEA